MLNSGKDSPWKVRSFPELRVWTCYVRDTILIIVKTVLMVANNYRFLLFTGYYKQSMKRVLLPLSFYRW